MTDFLENDHALSAWLRLTLTPGVGGQTQRTLLKAFGSPEAIFEASFLMVQKEVGEKAARLLFAPPDEARINAALLWSLIPDQHIVTLADEAYPKRLLEIADPPSLLYVRGHLSLLNRPTLAMVGSRNPTPQGEENAQHFASNLAKAGLVIASGLALGIDAAAHRGALLGKSESTLAFIGTGIDRIYPAKNLALARQIGTEGCMVSEFPLGTPAAPANFPRRNRLISGVSLGVLVVEAAIQSGSLITARCALEQGREVFAIPGSIHSPQSKGTHKLLKQGAKLVEAAEDILEELAFEPHKGEAKTKIKTALEANASVSALADKILEAIGFDPCTLESLALRTELSAEVISSELLLLELAGKIKQMPGGKVQRV